MSILDQTVSALPEVSWRLRDYLAPRARRPIPEPVQDEPAEAEAPVQAPEGESGTEEEDPPVSEAAAAQIREALAATGRGETADLGDFTQYADIPAEDGPAEADAEAGQ